MPKRKRIKDIMGLRLRYTVTEDNIMTAEQRSSSHCMIADAIKDAARETNLKISLLAVDLQTVRFSVPEWGLRYIYLTPRSAQQCIVDFDQGIHTEPFSNELRFPTVISMGHRSRGTARANLSSSPPTRPIIVTKSKTPKGEGPDGRKSVARVDKVIGGKAPPIGKFSRKRSFGLYGLRA